MRELAPRRELVYGAAKWSQQQCAEKREFAEGLLSEPLTGSTSARTVRSINPVQTGAIESACLEVDKGCCSRERSHRVEFRLALIECGHQRQSVKGRYSEGVDVGIMV
jgi:hypothetical protein